MNLKKYACVPSNSDFLDDNKHLGCLLLNIQHIMQDDAQKLSILSNDSGTKLSEVVGHVNPSFGNSLEELTVTVKDDDEKHYPQSLPNHTELKHSTEVLDTDTCTCTPAGNLQTIPRSMSTHSLKSTSTVSDSKPDLIKSTRHKHLNEFASTDKCTLSFELRQNATEVPQRPLSWGDEPFSWISKTDENTEREDFLLGRRGSSFRGHDRIKRGGIWTSEVKPTKSDGIWVTEIVPHDKNFIDEETDKWRLSLDQFSSKWQGPKRKAKHVSKRMRSYYKSQDELIKSFESVRYEMDGDKIDINTIRKKASAYAKITFFINLLLLFIKITAVVLSGSVSLISSLVDSSVDLVSGVVIWITTRLVHKTDRYRYPQGRAKLEPIAIVIISVIMAVASLHLVEETIEKIIHLAFGESDPPTMDWITLGISSVTVVIKLVLYLVCRKFPHHTIQALALDHRNDVISNTAAIVFGYIGSQEMQRQTNATGLIYLDPAGAILICIYISISWGHTGWGQIKMLTGHTAKPEFLNKLTWISFDHHKKILKINSVRAFHYGNNFLVEVEIVLPAKMTVEESHSIAEPLEQKLERLNEVERAFVHIDFE